MFRVTGECEVVVCVCAVACAHAWVCCRFFIASNEPSKAAREQRELVEALVGKGGGEDNVKRFFFDKTRELMERESCRAVGSSTRTVDVVRDVLKVVPIYWACDMVSRSCLCARSFDWCSLRMRFRRGYV